MRKLGPAGVISCALMLFGAPVWAAAAEPPSATTEGQSDPKADAKADAKPDPKPEIKPKTAKGDSKAVYSGKVSLTGFYYTESDGLGKTELDNDPTGLLPTKVATASKLGYIELRAIADARRILNGRIDFRVDLRVRATGNFDFEHKFDPEAQGTAFDDLTNNLGISARGYLGGPEYDLREAYVNVHFTPSWTLQIGRMFVREADGSKIDGLRLSRSFGPHWEGSLFAGGYPNPYSRSVLSDYIGKCGAGVAGNRSEPVTSTDPCTDLGSQLSFGVGAGARYNYNSLWGTIGLAGTIFTGPGTGGNLAPDPGGSLAAPVTQPNLYGPNDSLDSPRIFISWLNSWRPVERFDLFTDLVVDAYGSAGPQLTRLVALGTLRIIKDDRLTMRVGFSYMSSLAIDMFLNRLVYNRLSGSTLAAQGISFVENNLTVLRTGRAEGRVTLDSRLFRRLGVFVEGRVRYRSLVNGGSDPSVYQAKGTDSFDANVPTLAGDASVGIRDNGSIRHLRGGLTYSGIFDYLAQNHVINLDVGTDFWNDRVGLTLNYVFAMTKDKQAGVEDPCLAAQPYPACFGHRSGTTNEVGLTASVNPWRTLFFVFDYRFIAMATADDVLGSTPTILSHAILFRSEFRW